MSFACFLAQYFSQYLLKLAPMRVKTSSTKLVSTNVKDNTANLQHALVCDLVPMQRHDLVLVHKTANFALQGRLVLVDRLTSVVHLLDAAPTMILNSSNNSNNVAAMAELTPDAYFKNEKVFQLLLSSQRLVPFVVLDVELHHEQPQFHRSRQGPQTTSNNADDVSVCHARDAVDQHRAGPPKYALADVTVARQVDFGVNDQTFDCVTHLGHLLQAGDVVMGYDLSNWVASGGAEWNIQSSLPSTYQLPPVVLVRKEQIKKTDNHGSGTETMPPQKGEDRVKGVSKKKQRHRRRHEERKVKELQEAAARMGFLPQPPEKHNDENTDDDDAELEADLQAAEDELAASVEAQSAQT
jgi:nonsense-mediated mRNA decay protein 3